MSRTNKMPGRREPKMSINDVTPAEWDAVREKYKTWAESNTKTRKPDVVNHPEHYNTGKVECIEAIGESMTPEAFKGYLKGNCLKYLWRYERKGRPLEDLQKAEWYLKRLLEVNQ